LEHAHARRNRVKVAPGESGSNFIRLRKASNDEKPPNPGKSQPYRRSTMTTIFVYGTLKRGQRNHHYLMRGSEFLGSFRTAPKYRLYDAGHCPRMVKDEAEGHPVQGEVYKVSSDLLADLDFHEGVPNNYVRGPIEITQLQGVEAYFYRRSTRWAEEIGEFWPPVPHHSRLTRAFWRALKFLHRTVI
jgi:gamma-glutamylcyclotransferase (GGCT)/AIG2-like uncharacterized protein YtfP